MGQTLADASTSMAQEGHSFVFKRIRERFLVVNLRCAFFFMILAYLPNASVFHF
jgi:hypothetical protein